jgi:hypothetical protein
VEQPDDQFWKPVSFEPCPVEFPEWWAVETSDELILIGMEYTNMLKVQGGLLAWVSHSLQDKLGYPEDSVEVQSVLAMMSWGTNVVQDLHQWLQIYLDDYPHLRDSEECKMLMAREGEAHEFIMRVAARLRE